MQKQPKQKEPRRLMTMIWVCAAAVVLCSAYFLGRHHGAVRAQQHDNDGYRGKRLIAEKTPKQIGIKSEKAVSYDSGEASHDNKKPKLEPVEPDRALSQSDSAEAEHGLINPQVSPEAVAEIQGALTEFGKNSEADGADMRLLQKLACYKRGTLLSVAKGLMRYGSKDDKCNALAALGALCGKNRADVEQTVAMNGDANEPKPEIAKKTDEQTGTLASGKSASEKLGQESAARPVSQGSASEQNDAQAGGEMACRVDGDDSPVQGNLGTDDMALADVLNSALADEDADVRNAAFDTMFELPDADMNAATARLLGSENADMKVELLSRLGEGEATAVGLRTAAQAVADADEAVRSKAFENLKAMTGTSFSSEAQVAEWMEANYKNFLQPAENANTQIHKE